MGAASSFPPVLRLLAFRFEKLLVSQATDGHRVLFEDFVSNRLIFMYTLDEIFSSLEP